MTTRRDALRAGLASAALLALPRPLLASKSRRSSDTVVDRPYLDAALKAARWIQRSKIVTEHGITWPADPKDPKTVQNNLYSGSPGVVLFFLELYRATGDREWLDAASSGADHLAATLPPDDAPLKDGEGGLYTGLAGIGFVLRETHGVTRRASHYEAALRCIKSIVRNARVAGAGVEWGDTTDIISGSAGIGLVLLEARTWSANSTAHEVAIKAGRRLVELGIPERGGMKWLMTPTFRRNMPNFSHGTAGVSYFLATLHHETGERAFLDAALSGARYLQSIATTTERGTSLIYHNDPDGRDLYYLGWCHGPVGTTRLFHRLGVITRDPQWRYQVEAGAEGIVAAGVPAVRPPGFWNNVSQCCGNAGVADYFLTLHRVLHNPSHLVMARTMAADTLRRATEEDGGLKWVQAEHRVRPELLVAQTGYMQGAAGIGTMLLRFDAFERRSRTRTMLPDAPW